MPLCKASPPEFPKIYLFCRHRRAGNSLSERCPFLPHPLRSASGWRRLRRAQLCPCHARQDSEVLSSLFPDWPSRENMTRSGSALSAPPQPQKVPRIPSRTRGIPDAAMRSIYSAIHNRPASRPDHAVRKRSLCTVLPPHATRFSLLWPIRQARLLRQDRLRPETQARSATAGNSTGAYSLLVPSIRTAAVAITVSPLFTSSCMPPQVPIRTNVSAPALISSSMAIEADGPPMPVDVTLTLTPSR